MPTLHKNYVELNGNRKFQMIRLIAPCEGTLTHSLTYLLTYLLTYRLHTFNGSFPPSSSFSLSSSLPSPLLSLPPVLSSTVLPFP